MLRLLYQMIGIHYAKDDLHAVELAARSILAAVPNDVASRQFLGLVYYRTGRTDEALRIFDGAPDPHDGGREFQSDAGVGHFSGEPYSAVAACRVEATNRDSNLAQAWYDLGLILGQLGHPQRAAVAFHCALIARPTFPEAIQALNDIGPYRNKPIAGARDFAVADGFESASVKSLPGFYLRDANSARDQESTDDADD